MTDKVKNILLYTGLAGAIIAAIAYIILTLAIVQGFQTALDRDKQILFATLGAVFGLLINFSFRNQGIALAKREKKSQEVNQRYQDLTSNNKTTHKPHKIGYYMVIATIQDVFIKGSTIAISTFFILYIFMEGNGDYSLFLLALSNICMFAGFGLMNLSSIYDKYIEKHIPTLEGICNKLDQVGSIPPEEEENANV